jgi:hypothetical protein
MKDKKLSILKINIKKYHLFWQELLLWLLGLHKTFDLTHSQVFLAQPVLQLHFTKTCPSLIDCILTNQENWTAWIGFSQMLSLVVDGNFPAYIVQYPKINVLRCIRYSADRHYVRPL